MEQTSATTESKKPLFDISSAVLHIIAMVFMLMDHAWATVLPGWEWMTCVGRIAFPIFAFMIVEGYFHTKSVKKYILRLLIFAVISEVPFDYMVASTPFYPFHQNVMWTFLIALCGICCVDKIRQKGKLILTIFASAGIVLFCALFGSIAMVDYFGYGVLMVFGFYFFRGRRPWCFLGQFAVMLYLNYEIAGRVYELSLFGFTFEFYQQWFAMLALIPIWLYRGRQGYHSKPFQYFCYAFYPAHMALLAIAQAVIRSFIE